MATLQIYNDGAWETYTTQTPLGQVVFYRHQGETSTSAVASDSFPTAGASHVVAYLGTVNSGTVTGSTMNIAIETMAAAAATLTNPFVAPAAGGTIVQGTPHGTTATSNKAAYSSALSARSSVSMTLAGSTPNADIVIEVHYPRS